MKPIVYLFGNLAGGFSSYPEDHTKNIFQDFIKKSRNKLQIVLRRKDNLLYYGYVRSMNGTDHIGMALCVDCIYNDMSSLFSVFDSAYTEMVRQGVIIKMDGNTHISWATTNFASESVAITEISKHILQWAKLSSQNTQPLPPVNYSISINDCLELSLENSKAEIIDATKRYCNLYVTKKNSEIERITSFNHIVLDKSNEIRKLQAKLTFTIEEKNKQIADLKSKNAILKAKQKNLFGVGSLALIVTVLLCVIYVKVINPNEVTHYETGEFVYYGPIKDGKPNGIGVAIYPKNDKDGRKYYIGNFVNGNRQDSTAILFYQDGDYYYGSMNGDKWEKGMLYMNSDNSHFKGTFKDNNEFNGVWYEHIKSYNIVEGVKKK